MCYSTGSYQGLQGGPILGSSRRSRVLEIGTVTVGRNFVVPFVPDLYWSVSPGLQVAAADCINPMGSWKIIPKKFHAICKQDPRLEDPSRLVLVLMDPRWCTTGPGIHAVQIRIVPGLQRVQGFVQGFVPWYCFIFSFDFFVGVSRGLLDLSRVLLSGPRGPRERGSRSNALMDGQLCFTTMV